MDKEYMEKERSTQRHAVSIYQLDNAGSVIACNQEFLSLLNPSQQKQLFSKKIWEIFSDETSIAHSIKRNNFKAVSSGLIATMKETYLSQDGSLIEYIAHKLPLMDQKYGQTLLTLLVSSPLLSEQDEEMKMLALDHIISNLPGHVYWKNQSGVYLGCNNKQAHSLGLQHGLEVIGKTDFALPWSHSSAKAFRKHDKVVMESGKPLLTEESATIDGRDATVLSHKIPLKNSSGEIVGILGMSLDITKQKAMEEELKTAKDEAESANQAKTEFLYNMRHDLRTPFSGILSLAESMKESETDPEKKLHLSYVSESARVLLDYLNDILEFVKLERGQLPILDIKFDLYQLLNGLHDMMLPTAQEKALNFHVTCDATVPEYVIGDRMRTQRILINLVSNALKFTNKGSVTIHICKVSQEKNAVIIKFVIADTGMGIPRDKRDVIFERFNRLTSSYSGTYAGAGLGLRAVKQLLDELNGEIDVDSKTNQGSIFTVLIPYKIPLLPE